MKIINKTILKKSKLKLILLCSLFIQIAAHAADVGSAFSYQGQLLDQGVPANEKYDIRILAYKEEFGSDAQAEIEFFDVIVENGLFTIPEVDLGDALFMGNEVWLELEVGKAGSGSFESLQPRQRISAVPYAVQADFLASNGANSNDVLQFDGSNWVPQELENESPWSFSSADPNDIFYNGSGKVSINTSNPDAKLHVSSVTGENAFTASVNFRKKLVVNSNGGLSIGSAIESPLNGLWVEGSTKQPVTSNGMMKYMVHAFCAGTASSIVKSYNGVNSGTVFSLGSGNGSCTIAFPFNIDDRFWQATAVLPSDGERRAVSCKVSSSNNASLDCELFKASSGNLKNGEIMILLH